MRRTLALLVVCAVGGAGLAGTLAFFSPKLSGDPAPAPVHNPVWTEAKWPFPIDQWGTGKAFTCKAKDCGAEINVYLRAKLGFCNCTTGVSDDAELDRVNDVELFSSRFSPLGDGQPIAVAWMKGRSRGYTVEVSRGPSREVLAVAFNDRCDVIVATVVGNADRPSGWAPAVLAFLNGDTVLRWAEKTLGL